MNELKPLLKGYFSRKWLISIGVMACAYHIPLAFKTAGVSDSITLAAMVIVSGIGVSYGVVNLKDSKPNA